MKKLSINEILSELQNYLKRKELKIGIFDVETQNLFTDIEPKWNALSWDEKQEKRCSVIPKMRISVAGLLILDYTHKNPNYKYYEKDQISNLEEDLKGIDKIIGYNLHRFDYLVLSPYISKGNLEDYKVKTLDIWKLLKENTNEWISLNELGELNLGITKTVDTLKIPKIWKEGKHNEVRDYLKTDLDILAAIFYFGLLKKPITYYTKSYGKITDKVTKEIEWEI